MMKALVSSLVPTCQRMATETAWWHPLASMTQLLNETEILFAHSQRVLGVTERTLARYRDIGRTIHDPPDKYRKKARRNWPRVKLECFTKAPHTCCTTVEAWERFNQRLNGGKE